MAIFKTPDVRYGKLCQDFCVERNAHIFDTEIGKCDVLVEKLKPKVFVLDGDSVLTDGGFYHNYEGRVIKKFGTDN